MKKKSLRKLVSKITEGVLDKVIDLVLFGVYYSAEMGPFSGGSLYQGFSRIEKDFQQLNSQTLKRGLQKALEKGWINRNLQVTTKGQKRLESVLPKYEKKPKWSGKWYLVAYDIPENKKYLREILRGKLKELRFGQLHRSLFICPYNFLGDIEKIIKQYNLERYVLLAISPKLGRESSTELAERIWGLEQINKDYKEYIKEVKAKKLSRSEAIFRYLMILHGDSQLPIDLLPNDWRGEEAHKIYRKLIWKERFSHSSPLNE